MTLMNRWFEEVWNNGRESAIDEMSFHDVPGHGLQGPDGGEVRGMDAFKAFYRQFRAALSEIHVASKTSSQKATSRWLAAP